MRRSADFRHQRSRGSRVALLILHLMHGNFEQLKQPSKAADRFNSVLAAACPCSARIMEGFKLPYPNLQCLLRDDIGHVTIHMNHKLNC